MAGQRSKPKNVPQPEGEPARMEGSLQAGAGAESLSPELLAALSEASGAAPIDPEAMEAAAAVIAEAETTRSLEEDGGMAAGKQDQPSAATRELGGSGEDRGLGAGAMEDPFGAVPDLPTEGTLVPPESARFGSPMFSAAAMEAPDVVQNVAGAQAPGQANEKPFKPELVEKFVTDQRQEALWGRADAAKSAVDERVHSLTVARTLLDQIKSARNELMAGEENYEEAERFINEVEFRVIQNERMRAWSNTYGLLLFLYEVAWGVVLAWFMFVRYGTQFMTPDSALAVVLISMAMGGVGGAMGGLFSLVKHVALDQDFDRQHAIWYITAPIMGLGVGVAIYLIMGVGLLSLSTGQTASPSSSPLVIYILAWLGGYQHNVFTDIVKRVLKVFANEEEKKE